MKDRDFTLSVLVKRYWQYLALLLASLFICLASLFVNFAIEQDKLHHTQLYQAQAQNNRDAAQSLNVLNENFPTYQKYVNRNVIGRPNRLQHIELIKQLGESLGIPSVTFSLEESVYATSSNYYIYDEYIHLQYSIMRMDFVLDHEGQFEAFMFAMERNAQGVFSMQKCGMQREDFQGFEGGDLGLKASCELHWYLIKDLTEAWEKNEMVGL